MLHYESDKIKRQNDAENFLKDLGDFGGFFNNATKNQGIWNQNLVKFEDITISYDRNCYVSLNEFSDDNSSSSDNVSLIKGVYFDTDVHGLVENKNEIIEKCYDVLINAVKNGKLPFVNRIVLSGNGLATYVFYKDPITDVSLHTQIVSLLTDIFEDLFKDIPYVKQDNSAKTLHRVVRIPGTYNESAKRYATTAAIFSERLYAEEIAGIAYREKIVKKVFKSSTEKYANNAALSNYYRKMTKVVFDVMKERGGYSGDRRHMAVFLAYNFEKARTGSDEEALNKAFLLNDTFKKPLKEREVKSMALSVKKHSEKIENHGGGFYAVSESAFADMMGLTNSEINRSKLFCRKERYEKIASNKKVKSELYTKCLKARKNGMKILDICKNFGIARSTLNDLLKKEGVSKSWSKKSNFSVKSSSNNSLVTEKFCGKVEPVYDELFSDVRNVLYNTSRNVCIIGKAGTGKSTIVSEFVEKMEDKGLVVTKIAPTGLAASNIGGHTCHSYLKLNFDVYGPCAVVDKQDAELVSKSDVIVLDEVGALRFDYFDFISRVVLEANKLRIHKNPIRLVIAGDFFQTYPVVTRDDNELIKSLWGVKPRSGQAFEAENAWSKMNFKVVPLKTVIRQNNPEFVRNLDALRSGNVSCIPYFLARRDDGKMFDETATHICGHKALAKKINRVITNRHKKTDKFVTYEGVPAGDVTSWDCSVPRMLTLYEGKPVVAVKNTKNFKNGEMGIVTKVSPKTCKVLFRGRKDVVTVRRDTIATKNGEYNQLPLADAYALTVYKLQGQTLEKVVVHTEDLFDANQTYVALSRTRSLDALTVVGSIPVNLVAKDKQTLEKIRRICCE